MTEGWIPEDEWKTIVEHVPIVSVDLVVIRDDQILLGKRRNRPAKGEWFVPGGRVKKGETREEAVHRVASEELSLSVRVLESLGAYEHLYDDAEIAVESGKHYLANGFVVEPLEGELTTDSQHSEFGWFSIEELPPLHDHVSAYIRDAEPFA